MNKKLIALVSSVAFILTPATSVLAEGNDADTPSAENHTEVVGEESPQNYTDVDAASPENYTSEFYFSGSASSKTSVSVKGDKNVNGAYQYSLDNKFVTALIKKFNLKNIVDAFNLDDYFAEKKDGYTVTFSNKAVYKDGHVYRIHHFHYSPEGKGSDYDPKDPYDLKNYKEVAKDTKDYTAKDGKITVTLHGASPVLVEDLGLPKKAETKTSANGRKAALNTGVRY